MLGPLDEIQQHPVIQGEPILKDNFAATHRNAQRLLKLVNNLLDFSRVEAGRVQALYQPVNLAQLTSDLSSSFRSIIERAGMQLVVECEDLPQPVYVDQEMWEKIVLNLLSNAFKYTLAGTISVRLSTSGDFAQLQVEDTGTGIPAKELPHMFERFHRVEQAAGRTHEGSGIGLSLVHELVQLHCGHIAVESELGKGSVFTIRIPFGKMHLPPALVSATGKHIDTTFLKGAFLREAEGLLNNDTTAVANEDVIPGEKDTVLVVDDNSDMRQYLTRLLEDSYTVKTAVNGQDALQKIAAQNPDLVLSDIMMPVMDGKGLLHHLKNNPATFYIPLIFLSARAGDEARVDGLEDGADDYLVKPFSTKELLAKIKAQISASKTLLQRTVDLKSANEELLRINKDLIDFAFITSHDLQEPLRKIQTFAHILLDQQKEVDADKYLQKVITAANRMSRLIADLLEYSKLNSRAHHLEPVDLEKVLEQVKDDFELVIQRTNAKIHIAGLPVIKAVPVQMNQLFYNLLGNSLKFSEKEPVISITADLLSPQQQAGIDGLHSHFAYYEIKVKDNGIGFEQKYADKIFTIFQRLVKAADYEGTGIGLTICRRIAENHEGRIDVVSEIDHGSTFTVYLPAR